MSRAGSHQTPSHTRQLSNLLVGASDYESDPAAVRTSYTPPPPRSNTSLNLSVLQRYLPSIQDILSIAANAVIYTFNSGSESWDKAGIEGTLFVCAQSPLLDNASHRPRASVFILNRRGLHNLLVDLARVSHVEIMEELVILRVEGNHEEGEKVLGIWIHNDKDDTREINGTMIQNNWKIVRSAGMTEEKGLEAGPVMQAIGRRLSLSDLFGKKNDGHAI